jgi:hypothetical protein
MPETANTNLWGLKKDISIKHLLLLLQQDMGKDGFTLISADQLDNYSIRLGSTLTTATAYLYTYGQRADRYGLDLEYPVNVERDITQQEQSYEDLRYDWLLEILKQHLEWYERETHE